MTNTMIKKILPAVLSVMMATNAAYAAKVVDEANKKAVNHVSWFKTVPSHAADILNMNIPEGEVSLFFIRSQDNDPEQTSVNIAINDRFQSSLQPGNYTHVYGCSGVNIMSAVVTGYKTNDLLDNPTPFTLEPNQHYFFKVDVDESGNSVINQIIQDSALKYIESKAQQNHQISRVVDNCPEPVIVEAPVAPTPTPVPVLEEKVSIELEVLFDTDKAIVKPQYFNEVADVADFMNRYSNTTAVIEGHTDSRASEAYNQKLSQRRADAIKLILINQYRIAPDRVTAIGYGESRPIASNDTAEGRAQNRRVIAVIEEK